MSDTVVLSLRLPVPIAKRLEKLASTADRTKSYLAVKAIEEYIASEEEFLAGMAEAEADAEGGRMVDHREVSKWLGEIAAGKRKPPPQAAARRRGK